MNACNPALPSLRSFSVTKLASQAAYFLDQVSSPEYTVEEPVFGQIRLRSRFLAKFGSNPVFGRIRFEPGFWPNSVRTRFLAKFGSNPVFDRIRCQPGFGQIRSVPRTNVDFLKFYSMNI